MRVRSVSGTQAELSRASGLSSSTVFNIWHGTSPTLENASKIARGLEVQLEWLIDGAGPQRPSGIILANEADWLFVPRFDLTKLIGKGSRPDPEEKIPLRRDLLSRHVANLNNLWVTHMIGGSLPSVASSDDMILCRDVVDQLEEGRPYIISWGDGLSFRRAFPKPDGIHFRSEIPDVEEIFVPPSEADQVWPIARILGSLALRPAP